MLGQGGPETHLFGALGETPLNPNTEFFKRWSEKDSQGDFHMAATVPFVDPSCPLSEHSWGIIPMKAPQPAASQGEAGLR